MAALQLVIQKMLFVLVIMYQKVVSPFLPARCRFYPSCSAYAKEAVEKHKVSYSIYLVGKRLLKCHPLCNGGYDPVPEKKS